MDIIVLSHKLLQRTQMSKGSVTQISLKANEELIKRTKQTRRRHFYMVGKEALVNIADKGTKPEWQYEGIDFIDTIVSVSNNERTVIKIIKDHIRWDKNMNSFNYVVELTPESVEFNPEAEGSIKYETFLKGFNLLFKRDLVRRISRHKYMFNPEFFIISGELASHFEVLWTQAKAQGN